MVNFICELSKMNLKTLLVLAVSVSLCQGQCSDWGGANDNGLISRSRINEIFGANPLIINSLQGYIYPQNKLDKICVYEVRAPNGYCIDYSISSFAIFHTATLSIIDGIDVFGGSYIDNLTTQIMTINPTDVRSTTTNVMGVVAAANAPLSSSQTGAGFSFGLHFKIRKCTDDVTAVHELQLIESPLYN